MHNAWTVFFHATWEWLLTPATWAAVLLPGAFSAGYLWRYGASRCEALGVLLSVSLSFFTARLVTLDGDLQLHDHPWFAMAVVTLAGLRVYLPPVARAYALCWLSLTLSDVACMLWLGAGHPDVQLPRGIGGAGLGDALFAQPAWLALGLLGLQAARTWSERKRRDAH